MEIMNIERLPETFIWNDTVGLITKSLGAAAGSQKIYVNIDYVPPKAYSTKYHSHSQQEEFFMILSGSGTLRLNGKEEPVKQGDFIAKPAAQEIAHTFITLVMRAWSFWMWGQTKRRIPAIIRMRIYIFRNRTAIAGFLEVKI